MRIQLKRSSTLLADGSAKPPSSAQMEYGELAVNFNNDDPAIFFKDSDSNIIRISGSGSVGQGTASMTLDAGPGLYITNPTFTLDQTADQTIDIDLQLETSDELVGLEFASNRLRAKKATSTELGTIKEPSGVGVYMRQVTSSGEQWVQKDATVALPDGYPDLSDGDGSTLDDRFLNKNTSQTYSGTLLNVSQNLTVGGTLNTGAITATGTITGDVTGDLTGNADTATSATSATSATNATTAANLSRSVVAGNGLTGGGELTADRTINVAATDSTITVGADGIAVNQSALNFTPAANDGQININADNGLTASGNNATANQGGNTTRTISGVDATTSVKGVVQLNDTNTSTSTTLAATANAAKNAYDRAEAYAPAKDGTNATGTWGIDISGNAATATVAASVTGNIATADLADDANAIKVNSNTQDVDRPFIYIAGVDNASGSYETLLRDTQTTCYINPSTNKIGAAEFEASGNITSGGVVYGTEVDAPLFTNDGNIVIQPSGTTEGRSVSILPGQDDDGTGGVIYIGSATSGIGGVIRFLGNNSTSTYRFYVPGSSDTYGSLNMSNLTGNKSYTFPDQSGVVALTNGNVASATNADSADEADATYVAPSGFGSSSKRPIACFGQSSDISGGSYTQIKYAAADAPVVQGDGRLWVYNTCIADAFETSGNLTVNTVNASGNLNGTLGSTQVRNAIAQGGAGNLGTYGFLATQDSSNQAAGNQKSGSNCRWSNAAANMTNQTPSGSWRQMGRVAGDASDFGQKQSTLFLRYA